MSRILPIAGTGSNESELYVRLWKFARRLCRGHQGAEDLAQQAFCDALSAGALDWQYASVVLVNAWRKERRTAKRRGLDYQADISDIGDEEVKRLYVAATQGIYVELIGVVDALDHLPEPYRRILTLKAKGFDDPEIALLFAMPIEEVRWRVAYGRKLLRDRADWHEPKPRKGGKFIGVRRDRHRWVAAIRKDGKHIHLGQFATATEAACAYDDAARRIHGSKAKLNFPQVRAV